MLKNPRDKISKKQSGQDSSRLRKNKTMTTPSVPNVGVLKLKDAHVKHVTGVEVHIGNEEICDEPSRPPPLEYSWGCILFET